MAAATIAPMDQYNETLVSNVIPSDWNNPTPSGRYNLVVIGAGTAGLITAAGCAGLGGKVAMIERQHLGGDCLNVGCVPSKALIRASRAYAAVRDSSEFGIKVAGDVHVDFPEVMERMRRVRSQISHVDSAKRYSGLGVDVYIGDAKFTGEGKVAVGGQTLEYKKAVIATGARAIILPIEGLKEANPLTNETIFNLTELPRRLAVIGAGPIGLEMAQAFHRFGSEVTVINDGPQIMPREDQDAAAIVKKQLLKEGITILTGCHTKKVTQEANDKIVHYEMNGEKGSLCVDQILVGVGRGPNVEGMGLENVGVEFDKRRGVTVNDYLQTTNKRIYAAGDVCMAWKFTHAADAAARIVLRNALFGGKAKLSDIVMPWCTYTDPEVAHVGMYEAEATKKGFEVETIVREFNHVDRAIADGEEEGFVKVLYQKGTDKILGATIVASHAGDMINELTLAITHGLGLGKIATTIHPYPTQGEAIKHVADAYNRTKLTSFVKNLFTKWLSWTR